MIEPVPRLGDTIDDYCPRCRLLLNHAVASLVDGKVVKVICQTCHTEHPYRNAELPPKKKPTPRAALFEQVLVKTTSSPEVEPEAPAEEPAQVVEPEPPKKKKVATPARYISRHKTKSPRA
ncbi:MAG: hypothetical protein ACLQVM_11690 [Terriglobia bacterium]|jgi:hypothetical protein